MGRRLLKRIAQGRIKAELISKQWYDFKDYCGFGYCQTDHELHFDDYIILLEVKLTQCDQAIPQMVDLYLPVMKLVHQKPVIPVQVCKNLTHKPEDSIWDVEQLIKRPEMRIWTWHYLAEQ